MKFLRGVLLMIALVGAGCTSSTTAAGPSPTVTPTPTSLVTSPSPPPSPSAEGSPGPSSGDPGFIPALAAIQMLTPRLGWAVGSHHIFTTNDGSHWTTQYTSTNEYAGVDFISATTGWVVGLHELLGTTDGGRTWHELGEPGQPVRSVHFVSASHGWGIAGGADVEPFHGRLVPGSAGTLVVSMDGGHSWSNLGSPADPQTVCFSDSANGWLATAAGTIYRSHDEGQSWTQSLQMPGREPGLPSRASIECAAPSALWVEWAAGGAAAGSSPYIDYATVDGVTWKPALVETMTAGSFMPNVPPGPGSYPGSFSVVDPTDAVFVGDSAAAGTAACIVLSNGGSTVLRTGRIDDVQETFDAAFTSTSTGWVLVRQGSGDFVIEATTDGGYHWSPQLSVTVQSPG